MQKIKLSPLEKRILDNVYDFENKTLAILYLLITNRCEINSAYIKSRLAELDMNKKGISKILEGSSKKKKNGRIEFIAATFYDIAKFFSDEYQKLEHPPENIPNYIR